MPRARTGLNSVGVGAFFNVLNFGQMFMWHILLLPTALGLLAVIHVLLVRLRGVVPSFPARGPADLDSGPDAAVGAVPSQEGDRP